jgi:two-component system, NarL family, sensor histidine kinase DegS
VIGSGRVLGALMIASRFERDYTDDDEAQLTRKAESVSLAAEMLCLYDDALRSERAKLAEEVHDGLSQNLFGLKLLLADAGDLSGTPEQRLGRMQEIRGLLDDTATEVRRLIADLRGSTRVEPDLLGAISDHLAHFYRLSSIPVELAIQLPPGEDIPCSESHEVLRIVQEALANIRRHAEASWARVEVVREPGACRITIADDGKGFDPAHTGAHGHFGLAIMRDRAARFKGDLRVQSAPGPGTAIVLRIPV